MEAFSKSQKCAGSKALYSHRAQAQALFLESLKLLRQSRQKVSSFSLMTRADAAAAGESGNSRRTTAARDYTAEGSSVSDLTLVA